MSSKDAGRAVVVAVEAKRRGLRAQRQRVELVNDLDDVRVPFFAALAALASINTVLRKPGYVMLCTVLNDRECKSLEPR